MDRCTSPCPPPCPIMFRSSWLFVIRSPPRAWMTSGPCSPTRCQPSAAPPVPIAYAEPRGTRPPRVRGAERPATAVDGPDVGRRSRHVGERVQDVAGGPGDVVLREVGRN